METDWFNLSGLVDRMGQLMDIENFDTLSEEERMSKIMETKWKYCQPYSIASADNPEEIR